LKTLVINASVAVKWLFPAEEKHAEKTRAET
jgi:hypothetical protein